ncbi:hypothetical protein QUF73_04345 [Cytobacillus sp. NJ13]|nr:hypothetical protein [Cytobacillus sp. NJ13]
MTVINVPAGGSINAAFVGANPGDTIRVAAGVFEENVVIPARTGSPQTSWSWDRPDNFGWDRFRW